MTYDEGSELFRELLGDGLGEELRTAVQRFDWHSHVEIAFEEGEGGAGWSRALALMPEAADPEVAERLARYEAAVEGR